MWSHMTFKAFLVLKFPFPTYILSGVLLSLLVMEPAIYFVKKKKKKVKKIEHLPPTIESVPDI